MKINLYDVAVLTLLIVCCRGEDEYEECEFEDCTSDEISKKIQNLQQEGGEYLQKVMKQLQEDRVEDEMEEVPDPSSLLYTHRVQEGEYEGIHYSGVTPVYNITAPTPNPSVQVQIPQEIPPIKMSKEELLALYEAALAKATQLQFTNHIEKPESEAIDSDSKNAPVSPSHQGQMQGPVSGYYYYYFPIKTFASYKSKFKPGEHATDAPSSSLKMTESSPHELHATVTMVDSSNKSVEPLFVAISSFIGLALMFLFSIIFVPRLHRIRSKNAQFKDTDDEMASLGLIIVEAMAGRDCSERFACEITKIFRGLKSSNKALRILEILLPPKFSQQISQIRKAAGKRAKCGYIPCKIKKEKPPPANNTIKVYKPKPWRGGKPTAHDLWMKNFEKKKSPPKQQSNQQQKKKNQQNRQPPLRKT